MDAFCLDQTAALSSSTVHDIDFEVPGEFNTGQHQANGTEDNNCH